MRPWSLLWLGQTRWRLQGLLSRVKQLNLNCSEILAYLFSLLQDATNTTTGICDSSVPRKKVTATWGQTLHLSCFLTLPTIFATQELTWFHSSKERGRTKIVYKYQATLSPYIFSQLECFSSNKYVETSQRGLLIFTVFINDVGLYDCFMGQSLLCSFDVAIDLTRCIVPEWKGDYRRVYSSWCHEFERYKYEMRSWEESRLVSWGEAIVLEGYSMTSVVAMFR